ncbi:MAG: GNAT family N-acetyltransferase [bacterium]|nr:GNAT family N-acetyltransferase [bacterium]
MADVLIRRMEDRDVNTIGQLWYQLSLHHEPFAKYYEVKRDTEALLIEHVKDLIRRSCIFFVAEVDGRVTGFVSGYVIMRNPQLAVERIGKVDNIFVRDEFRGRGIGTQLLEALCTYLRGQGILYIELSCDFANQKAMKLYKKLGFKEQKTLLVREG